MKVKNPIISGFNPDPSIICVDGDYYIATSTFEWFGGICIYHSKDLVNWKLITRPLVSSEMLDLQGNSASSGVWAPNLSYNDGKYYIAFTNVKSWDESIFKDTPNFIIMSDNIRGPWTVPKLINCTGHDPSIFHDNGKMWFLNVLWDYRLADPLSFGGIILQEIDKNNLELKGDVYNIFEGTKYGWAEGPNLYKRGEYYYLLTAEGATGLNHGITVCRAKSITGPYELHPDHSLATTRFDKNYPIQKVGHGSLCFNEDKTWLAFLCSRPFNKKQTCILGRETGIAEIIWYNGWPYLKNGGYLPPYELDLSITKQDLHSKLYTFDNLEFLQDFQTLRVPFTKEQFALIDGKLRIYGKESLSSRHRQSVIAIRQKDFNFEATTSFSFSPQKFQHMAGMIYRYNERNQYFIRLTYDERVNKNCIGIIKMDKGNMTILVDKPLEIDRTKIFLKIKATYDSFDCLYSLDGRNYTVILEQIDSSILTDEYDTLGFTGSFVGLNCIDLEKHKIYADFDFFEYKALKGENFGE